MLRSLHVENFRALREFRMTGLGRVNLLVGTNNCGKTSVLEAVDVLLSPGTSLAMWHALYRRGEFVDVSGRRDVELVRLLHGHRIDVGSGFSIAGKNDQSSVRVDASVRHVTREDADLIARNRSRSPSEGDPSDPFRMILDVLWQQQDRVVSTLLWPMAIGGGVDLNAAVESRPGGESRVQFVTTEGLSPYQVTNWFAQVTLTPEEGVVLDALRTIEPGLERIAIVDTQEVYAKRATSRIRGGLGVMVDGQRIPIGSMGDGIWRLLGIALALVRARDGVLLVDEIDTGLHYTVLEKMWRLVFETAERLNVQVFATTHSRDCYEALAAITQPDRREVSIQRIERGRVDSIGFTEGAIAAAAERDIEVR